MAIQSTLFASILKWIGPWLLKQLVPVLDPEASAKAAELLAKFDAIAKRTKEAEELQRQADLKYAAAELYRQEKDAEIAKADAIVAQDEQAIRDSEARRENLARKRGEIEDEIARVKATIPDRSDDDAFSGRLPGSKP